MRPLLAAILFALSCYAVGFVGGYDAGERKTWGAAAALQVNRDAKADPAGRLDGTPPVTGRP